MIWCLTILGSSKLILDVQKIWKKARINWEEKALILHLLFFRYSPSSLSVLFPFLLNLFFTFSNPSTRQENVRPALQFTFPGTCYTAICFFTNRLRICKFIQLSLLKCTSKSLKKVYPHWNKNECTRNAPLLCSRRPCLARRPSSFHRPSA